MMPCLNRSGGTLYLLIGRCGMRLPSIEAFTSSIPVSSWIDPPKRRDAQQATIAPQYMLPIRGVSDAHPQNMGSESKPSIILRATSEIHVGSPQEMEHIGAFFGQDSRSGDVVLLWGDIGTGKTGFARGFIRARLGDPHLAVTSPTYLLDNTYEAKDEDLTVHHMDLYRFHQGHDLHVVDIPRVLETGVCLVEWPDRLGAAKPSNRLDIHLVAVSESERMVTLTGHGAWWAGAVDDFKDNQG